MNNTLDAAKSYVATGISILPLKEKSKIPAIPSWKEYQTRKPTENELVAWFGNGSRHNIGIVTGAISNLAVVDLDSKEAVELVKAKGGLITPTVKTSKGFHLYCLYKDGIRNFQKRADLPGIDLRGEGGYVVAPPSTHESGHIYQWGKERGLDIPLADLPSWILAERPEDKQPITELYNGIEKGGRNMALARLVGSWVNDGGTLEEITEQALLWNQGNRPPLPEHEVRGTVKSIFEAHDRNRPKDIWEEPILFGEIETPEIPANLLPGYLGEYCKAVSDNTQTPPGLAVMMGLSTIAACLQKRIEVSPYGDDYREPVSLWTVTALPPSERKSPVKAAMTEPLTAWEDERASILESEIREVQTKRDVFLKRIDSLKAQAAKADNLIDREKAFSEIREIQEGLPEEKKAPRLWTDDTTPERLQMLLVEYEERMALLSDEGGIFEIMGGLYSDGRANLNVFLQSYSGSKVRAERSDRTVTLHRPALTFGLTVQPDVLSDFSQGSKRIFRGNGTLARFFYCIPKSNIGSRDMGRRVSIPENIKAKYRAGIFNLLSIEPIHDEHGREKAKILTLSREALDSWIRFSQYIESKQGPDREFEYMQDWTGKLPGAALRIAGLFHIIKHGIDKPTIDQETIEQALDLCQLFIPHTKAAFDLMGGDHAVNDAKHVYRWILTKGEDSFIKSHCHKALEGRFRKVERLDKALQVLTERHIISEPHRRETGGRPGVYYLVNPAVLKEGV